MTIQLDHADAAYAPGQPIAGTVAWDLDRKAERVVVRLVWRSTGQADDDIGVAAKQELDAGSRKGEGTFRFPPLQGPHGFAGKLFKAPRKVQATTGPVSTIGQKSFTLSLTKQAVGL